MKMARLGLGKLGVSDEAIDRAVDVYRTTDSERFSRQFETGDVSAAAEAIVTEPRVLPEGG
jgi:hypothetical protein